MSSTRHAKDGALHQERFSSAAEFEKGLLANLVAKRCEVVNGAEDRELIWTLQLLSHREGLEKVAADLLQQFSDRIGTPAMRRFGMAPHRVYTADQVRKIRAEIPGGVQDFPLAGEKRAIENLLELSGRTPACHSQHPETYRLERFVDLKRLATETLPRLLSQLCTDPSFKIETCRPWYFRTLIPSLREYLAARIEARREKIVVTELGRQVGDELDYALQSGCMVVIEGLARTGKTFSARAWCELHPGQARFVQVPSTNDDIGFYRKIAEAIGSASALSLKGVQLRERVENTLQTSKLMLVLDEAHYLWPQNIRREARPYRLNWVMTALVNYGVPIAIVTTPQFARDQSIVEKRSGWTSEQFIGRIGHSKKLPDTLSKKDLEAVARHFLPDGDARSIGALALYAQASAKYLAAIETSVTRARFLASKEGRTEVGFEDIKRVIQESAIAVGPEPKVPVPRGQPVAPAVARSISDAPPGRVTALPAVGGRAMAPLVEAETDD